MINVILGKHYKNKTKANVDKTGVEFAQFGRILAINLMKSSSLILPYPLYYIMYKGLSYVIVLHREC